MIPKKIWTRLSQLPEVGGEVQRDPQVLRQPCLHRWVLVGGVVVADQVQRHPRIGLGDLLEERQELLMPVAGVAGVDTCFDVGSATTCSGVARSSSPPGQEWRRSAAVTTYLW